MCMILLRAINNLPYVRLSAFFVGCLKKNYSDQGGWGADALDFIVQNGVPSVEFWPEKSMSRSNDNPRTRANAVLHKAVDVWADLGRAVYDRNLTEDQGMTLLLSRNPLIADLNWWGHSVCIMDPVQVKTCLASDLGSLDFNNPGDLAVYADAFGKRGINSWTDSYGDLGEFVLTGTKAHIDGGAAPRSTMPSLV